MVVQGYGLTEIAGGSFITAGHEESLHWGSAGRLAGGFEVKIIDPVTGDGLPPGKQGELWIKGPSVMKGKMNSKTGCYLVFLQQ